MNLEELDCLHRDCDQLVHRSQLLVAADDIRPRILKMAAGFERLAAVTPAMFENILDEELVKFDKYLSELAGMKRKHEGLLNETQVSFIVDFASLAGLTSLDRHVTRSFSSRGERIQLLKSENRHCNYWILLTSNIEKLQKIWKRVSM